MAKALTILSFVLVCWVAHRTLRVRDACVTSPFIAYVLFDDARAENCAFESRLSLQRSALDRTRVGYLRTLETLSPLVALFPEARPHMTVEITELEPDAFALGERGGLRLGSNWLAQPLQVRRALTMALLKNQVPSGNLDVLTDFVVLALFDDAPADRVLRRETKFPTVALGLDSYCKSPVRSLAHARLCELKPQTAAGDAWGMRPLLAAALWRTFSRVTIADQVAVLKRLRTVPTLPPIEANGAANVENLVDRFTNSLRTWSRDLGLPEDRRALAELEVEAPTRWELTVDLTKSPAWKEIVEQLKARSRYRQRERALVFTPEGEVALPSGLPVAWSAADVQSQKHVVIACSWPRPGEAVHVRARQMFARQACGKLDHAFWD